MLSLLKDPAQFKWKVIVAPGETMDPGLNLYFVGVNFYGLEGCLLHIRPYNGMGQLTVENVSHVEVNHFLHQLGILLWAYQVIHGMWHDVAKSIGG